MPFIVIYTETLMAPVISGSGMFLTYVLPSVSIVESLLT